MSTDDFANAFGSDYMNAADLSRFLTDAGLTQDQRLPTTLERVRKEEVGREREEKWVAYFIDGNGRPHLKPLSLNKGNGKALVEAFGSAAGCAGRPVELWLELRFFEGKPVKGIAIGPRAVSKADDLDDDIPFELEKSRS
jgi:hypothetical protein